jgi:hypothetical protein
MYSIACSAPESSKPHSSFNQITVAQLPAAEAETPIGEVCGSRSLIFCRRSFRYVTTALRFAPELRHARRERWAALRARLHQHAARFAFDPANRHELLPSSMMSPRCSRRQSLRQACQQQFHRVRQLRVTASFRDGAAAGDRRQPRAAPRPQFAIDAVAMDVRAITSAPRSDPSESISRTAS